jgi:beta-lactamase regulating signal transducer with metallopeptidase domain
MAALELLSHPMWQRLAWTLVHFVWQGAAVGALLLIVLTLLRGANARYLAALAALLALVACPLATAALLSEPVSTTHAMAPAADIPFAPGEGRSSAVLVDTSVPLSLFATAQPYVVLAWLAGVMALGGRLLISYLGVRSLRASADTLEGPLRLTFYQLSRRMRVRGRVQIKASHVVREALVVGLFRPLILIPAAWLTEMPASTLEAVLAHELAHIRRHDLWVNLLQRVTETLLFYHPAVWYVSRVLRVEREKCCDELAVAATGERLVYVEALQLVAHRRLAASPSILATAIGGTRTMNLLERVRNVLGIRPAASTARYWPVGIAALVLPLGLWCVTAGLAPVATADEGEKPAAKEGERKEGERPDPNRPEGERKEGERRDPNREGERREVERPRDGDRRPEGPREGDRRPEGPRREGDRPRPEGPREGDRRPEGPRPDGPRPDGPRPEGPRPGEHDLVRLIMELRMEVMQLRREVNEMRSGRGPHPEGFRPDGPRPEHREGDRPRPEGERRPEGDRPRPEGDRRPEPDRPRPEGERRPDAPRKEVERPQLSAEERAQLEKLEQAVRNAEGPDAREKAMKTLQETMRAIKAKKLGERER